MEPGKIFLLNTGGSGDAGYTQTITYSPGNRLYRITNDGHAIADYPGPALMTIRVTRNVWWWTTTLFYELSAGRSVDVYGATIKIEALQDLKLVGSYDTI